MCTFSILPFIPMTKSSTQKPLIDLSEDEQMDIINKSGVAHKLKESRQEEQDVAFFGFLLSMSAMFLFGSSNHISDNTIGMFEYLVYIQFENPSVAPPIDYFGLASAYLPHAICITFLSYASFYVKNSRAFQYIFCLSAIGCGCMVMYQILQGMVSLSIKR